MNPTQSFFLGGWIKNDRFSFAGFFLGGGVRCGGGGFFFGSLVLQGVKGKSGKNKF